VPRPAAIARTEPVSHDLLAEWSADPSRTLPLLSPPADGGTLEDDSLF